MKLKLNNLFWILSFLLLILVSILTYYIFQASSFKLFLIIEILIALIAIYLLVFYRIIIKPLQIIGGGMELLKEQDFSSRLRHVGQMEADKIVDVFNKMMEQLKNERLHLREQNHFLDLLIEASPMGVIILDLDGLIISINPAAKKIFNLKKNENSKEFILQNRDNPLTQELLKIEQNSSQIIRLSNAHIYKCMHYSFLNKGFHQSFYLIESLTEEVFKAEKKAYEKVIRMIAHEVNNTTAGITSTLDTLQNTSFNDMIENQHIHDFLQIAIDRCYGMNRFITNFANVIRIPPPNLRQENLNILVASGKRFMETLCNNRNIHIELDLCKNPLWVMIDSVLFEQILVNIIKNAAESIESDGTITIKTTNNPACLEIIDTGKGIDKETELKLFSPFFSTKPNGQGLGLIFIREILISHGVDFSLRTYEDKLTRFKIFF